MRGRAWEIERHKTPFTKGEARTASGSLAGLASTFAAEPAAVQPASRWRYARRTSCLPLPRKKTPGGGRKETPSASRWRPPRQGKMPAEKVKSLSMVREKPLKSVFSPHWEDIFPLGPAFEPSAEAILSSKWEKMPHQERLEPLKEEKYQSMGGENASSRGVFTSHGGYFCSRGGS